MIKITIYMCTTFIWMVLAREPVKIVAVDRLRWDFLQLEETLWNSVLDYAENNIGENGEGHQILLVKKLSQFGDELADKMGQVCVRRRKNFAVIIL